MISQIFEKKYPILIILSKIKNPQFRYFHMADIMARELISNQIRYSVEVYDNIAYFEELDKNGRVIEVVALNLDIGEYEVVDLEKYLKGGD